jgi:23S rRNA pseudouridine1911/1915/1917 synthase
MRTYVANQPAPLLEFLLGALGQKRRAVKDLLKFGAIAVNGQRVRQFDHALSAGDRITIGSVRSGVAETRLENAAIEIVYEDDALLVLDKPSGLLTVATANDKRDTLEHRLNGYLGERDAARAEHALVVHRLDQGTSGLVMFAKNEMAKSLLQEAWPSVEKTYWAITDRRPADDQGVVSSYLIESATLKVYSVDHPRPRARLATTHYRVALVRDPYALLAVRLETGRKHQIRVHLAELGCAVIGDKRYGSKADPVGRLGLHATRLEFNHPYTQQRLRFDAPLPAPLAKLFPQASLEDE